MNSSSEAHAERRRNRAVCGSVETLPRSETGTPASRRTGTRAATGMRADAGAHRASTGTPRCLRRLLRDRRSGQRPAEQQPARQRHESSPCQFSSHSTPPSSQSAPPDRGSNLWAAPGFNLRLSIRVLCFLAVRSLRASRYPLWVSAFIVLRRDQAPMRFRSSFDQEVEGCVEAALRCRQAMPIHASRTISSGLRSRRTA